METLLVLGAGRNQQPLIEAAKSAGLRVAAIDPDRRAVGFALADDHAVCDLADLGSCLDFARRQCVTAACSMAAEYPLPVLAAICRRLSLPGLSSETVALATNKRLMRNALVRGGVGCPRHRCVSHLADAVSAVREIDAATIFKPAIGNGKKGITHLPPEPRVVEIEAAFLHAMRYTRGDGIMVEEFVSGPESSVEAVTIEGTTHIVAVTDKLTSGEPHFVEIGHSQPTRVGAEGERRLVETAVAAVAALGLDGSPSHTEIRLGPQGPCVMEIAGRLAGGFIASHLVPLSCGVDLVGAALALARGRTPELSRSVSRGAAIRFVLPLPGVLRGVRGLDDARAQPGIRNVEIYIEPGDRMADLVDNSCRVGHVIASADSAREAIEAAKYALSRLTIDVENGP